MLGSAIQTMILYIVLQVAPATVPATPSMTLCRVPIVRSITRVEPKGPQAAPANRFSQCRSFRKTVMLLALSTHKEAAKAAPSKPLISVWMVPLLALRTSNRSPVR